MNMLAFSMNFKSSALLMVFVIFYTKKFVGLCSEKLIPTAKSLSFWWDSDGTKHCMAREEISSLEA